MGKERVNNKRSKNEARVGLNPFAVLGIRMCIYEIEYFLILDIDQAVYTVSIY